MIWTCPWRGNLSYYCKNSCNLCMFLQFLNFLIYRMTSALNYKSNYTKAKRATENEFVIAAVTGQ